MDLMTHRSSATSGGADPTAKKENPALPEATPAFSAVLVLPFLAIPFGVATRRGGQTVGLLRTYNRNDANPYVDYPIPTGLGDGRNVLVATAGEAAIAVGGHHRDLGVAQHARHRRWLRAGPARQGRGHGRAGRPGLGDGCLHQDSFVHEGESVVERGPTEPVAVGDLDDRHAGAVERPLSILEGTFA